MLTGAYTLLITPFDPKGGLDEGGLRRLVRRQVEAGVDGLAPLGVTGENSLLSDEEVVRVLKIVLEEKGDCKVAPDTCTNSLERTLERVKLYADMGCDYAVVYVPFLVLPKEDGVIFFYERLADESKLPIIIHNAPGRVGINLSPEAIARLAEHPNIIGIKDGNKQMDHLAKVIYLTRDKDFSVFTGKDTTAYPLMSFGGEGVFTVAGNVVPEVMKNLIAYALNNELEKAQALHYEYYDLFEALRFETNPMACKEALNLMGLPGGGLRLPLTSLSEPKREVLSRILKEKGLI
jgi:4-hydroxy-tetrahydrodipicolinate synthase